MNLEVLARNMFRFGIMSFSAFWALWALGIASGGKGMAAGIAVSIFVTAALEYHADEVKK